MQPREPGIPFNQPGDFLGTDPADWLARDADELRGGYNLTDTPWVEAVAELSDSMEEPAQFAKLIRRASGRQSANQSRDIELFDVRQVRQVS